MERHNLDSEERANEADALDDAVIGADDTGMLNEQRISIESEIIGELGEGDPEARD